MDAKTRFALGFVSFVVIVGGVSLLLSDGATPSGTQSADEQASAARDRVDAPSSGASRSPRGPQRLVEEAGGAPSTGVLAEQPRRRDGATGRTEDHVVLRSDAGEVATTGHSPPTPPTPNSHGGTAWDDPTNDRVLGPKEWMAPTDEEERARIDEVFEKSRAARYDPRLSNQERGQSIAAMKTVVDACFSALQQRAPGASGRLIVAWTAGASGGEGRISNPRIKVNYKLEDEAFEACILDGAQNLRFSAADGDPIEVEVPFFYDGAF